MKNDAKPDEPVRDLEFWKGDALRAREERDRSKERARALEAELGDLRARETERARQEAAVRDQAEREKLEREGKYKELLDSATRRHGEELGRLRRAAAQRVVPAAILAAARKIPHLAPEAVGDLPDLIRPHTRLNEETFEVEVLGPDGKPLCDEQGRAVALDQFVAGFLQARPYLLLDRMQPGTGLAPGARGGDGATLNIEGALRDPQLASAWRARDPEGYKRAVEEYHSPERVKERARAKFAGAA